MLRNGSSSSNSNSNAMVDSQQCRSHFESHDGCDVTIDGVTPAAVCWPTRPSVDAAERADSIEQNAGWLPTGR
jgi:hypothetical protein